METELEALPPKLSIIAAASSRADFITEWFSLPQSQHQIKLLREAGVSFDSTDAVKDSRFTGMTFVLTGELSGYKRDEAAAIIESYGGKASWLYRLLHRHIWQSILVGFKENDVCSCR